MKGEKLPDGFDKDKTNIAIFNSSEDEMKVIKDWVFPQYKDQNEALKKIVDNFKGRTDMHLYLRVHPNLINVENSQIEELKAISSDNFTIIFPDESVNSYALIHACDKVVSFGSTVGIESSYLNKPSILFGNSFYRGLDCVYEPKTYDELFDLIQRDDLTAKSNFNIFLYPFTVYHRGDKLNNFEFGGKKNSKYKGELIKRVYLLIYMKNLFHWNRMNKMYFGNGLKFKDLFLLRSHKFDRTFRKH